MLAMLLGCLFGTSSAFAEGASIELSGVPATLQSPSIFTMAVKGTTGTGGSGVIKIFTGPQPCDANSAEEQTNQPGDVIISGPRGEEVPLVGGFPPGPFSVFAEVGSSAELTYALDHGNDPTGPVPYTVCAYLEAAGVSTVDAATASASFSLLPAATSSATGVEGTASTGTCVVPRIKGTKLAAAEKALAHDHCAVGRVKKVSSKHVKKGRVVSQSQTAGKVLPAGSKVNILISKG
jgi:hypothetical protein